MPCFLRMFASIGLRVTSSLNALNLHIADTPEINGGCPVTALVPKNQKRYAINGNAELRWETMITWYLDKNGENEAERHAN